MLVFHSESTWGQVSCELVQDSSSQWLAGLISTPSSTASTQLQGVFKASHFTPVLYISLCDLTVLYARPNSFQWSAEFSLSLLLIPGWPYLPCTHSSIHTDSWILLIWGLNRASSCFTFYLVPIKPHSAPSLWVQLIWAHTYKVFKTDFFLLQIHTDSVTTPTKFTTIFHSVENLLFSHVYAFSSLPWL